MKKKLFILSAVVLTGVYVSAQIVEVSVYDDCSKNGYTKVIDPMTGTAPVLSSSGRTSCEWVQLWENGPKWATFNVGATITDYGNLTVGADATPFQNYGDQAPFYNTANVGGLYAWNNPLQNARKTAWTDTIRTDVGDVATMLWGGNWETPTKEQLDSLQNDSITTWIWCDGSTTQYVKGCTLKGYKVSGGGDYAKYSIFLPAAGYFLYASCMVYTASSVGDHWSRIKFDSSNAYYLSFHPDIYGICSNGRKYGRSVRAILVK